MNENQQTTLTSTVYLPTNLFTPPICSCRSFTSLNLPCGCMAKAFSSVCGRDFFDERNLQEQWRISSHPLYDEIITLLAGKPVTNHQSNELIKTVDPRNRFHALKSISVPKTEQQRRSNIQGLTEKIQQDRFVYTVLHDLFSQPLDV